MANYIPKIKKDQNDGGRDIIMGVERNGVTCTLPKLSLGEFYALKREMDNFLNEY